MLSIEALLIATAIVVISLATFVWLSKRGSRWIFTKVAIILAAAYIGFWIVVRINERHPARAAEGFSDYLLIFSPYVLIPLVVVGVLIDLGVTAIRRIRSQD